MIYKDKKEVYIRCKNQIGKNKTNKYKNEKKRRMGGGG
jgi:hypothetical protein